MDPAEDHPDLVDPVHDQPGLGRRGVGAAPASWTGLTDHLQSLGYTPDQLVTAGVATRTRGARVIDKFRNRIVFPYRDQSGKVVGVTARISPTATDTGDGRSPKYLNTPETAAYRKGELVYGLDPDAIGRLAADARPVLVEGPTDYAALHQAAARLTEQTGVEIVPVPACGTGITAQHLQALRDATGRDLTDLIVDLDLDKAGRTAAARVWAMLTPPRKPPTLRRSTWPPIPPRPRSTTLRLPPTLWQRPSR